MYVFTLSPYVDEFNTIGIQTITPTMPEVPQSGMEQTEKGKGEEMKAIPYIISMKRYRPFPWQDRLCDVLVALLICGMFYILLRFA